MDKHNYWWLIAIVIVFVVFMSQQQIEKKTDWYGGSKDNCESHRQPYLNNICVTNCILITAENAGCNHDILDSNIGKYFFFSENDYGCGKYALLNCLYGIPSCSGECLNTHTQCSGNGYQTCGNYDSDTCTEWSPVTSCPSGQTCSGGVCSGGTTCNTPADTNCNGCIEDIGEWGNAVVNWKSQTGGINDDNWIQIVPKWKTQEGC